MANYAGRFFTHQMKEVPRFVDQFPSKLKFKARMTKHKLSFKNPTMGQVVILPKVDELEKIRYPDGKLLPRFLDAEVKGMIQMAPYRRLLAIGDHMTELIRYERIEGNRVNLHDVRMYTELLLQLAIANGDRHRPTMELVDFYIKDKDLIPKLFQVLIPRFVGGAAATASGNQQSFSPNPKSVAMPTRFTDFYNLPPSDMRQFRAENVRERRLEGILELRGHPWPPVIPRRRDQSGLITNVLLRAAKSSREERKRKQALESVKNKIGGVKESLEPKMKQNSAEAVAAASAVDNPYLKYANDVNEQLVDDSLEEEAESEVNMKLKNLDLNL